MQYGQPLRKEWKPEAHIYQMGADSRRWCVWTCLKRPSLFASTKVILYLANTRTFKNIGRSFQIQAFLINWAYSQQLLKFKKVLRTVKIMKNLYNLNNERPTDIILSRNAMLLLFEIRKLIRRKDPENWFYKFCFSVWLDPLSKLLFIVAILPNFLSKLVCSFLKAKFPPSAKKFPQQLEKVTLYCPTAEERIGKIKLKTILLK